MSIPSPELPFHQPDLNHEHREAELDVHHRGPRLYNNLAMYTSAYWHNRQSEPTQPQVNVRVTRGGNLSSPFLRTVSTPGQSHICDRVANGGKPTFIGVPVLA